MATKNKTNQGSERHGSYEGHDTPLDAKRLKKGSFQAVGSSVPTSETARSANQKTGKVFGDGSEDR